MKMSDGAHATAIKFFGKAVKRARNKRGAGMIERIGHASEWEIKSR
jgi:hypothetical protein